MSVVIAAIVKGLVEQGDGTTHFGSLLGYRHHVREAKDAGVVAEGPKGLMVTPLGMEWYESARMGALSGGRFAYWRLGKNYDWTPPSGAALIGPEGRSPKTSG